MSRFKSIRIQTPAFDSAAAVLESTGHRSGCNRLSCANHVTAEWGGFQEISETCPIAFTDRTIRFHFLCERDITWYNRGYSSWGYIP